MRSVRWADAAQDDLDGIVDYYDEIDPGVADAIIARIENSHGPLVSHPLAGAEVGAFGLRKWSVKRTSYVLIYRPVAEGIEIARVLHSKRNWSALIE